jgi:transcriptional regulator with XRE-family HTH domain
MDSVNIGSVGRKVKELRKERGMTLQYLAQLSAISTGMLSKIENFRTVPSLEVLIKIAGGLKVELGELVKGVNTQINQQACQVIPASEYVLENRDDSPDFSYLRIVSEEIRAKIVKLVKVSIPAGTERPHITTDARQMVYVISGSIEYTFDKKYSVPAGDIAIFEGRQSHSLRNTSDTEAELLVIYLLD